MLAKNRRIPRARFKEGTQKECKRYLSAHLSLVVCSNPNEHSRFTFVAAKKVAKKASARNLFRRRGYAIIRKHQKRIQEEYICIFYLKHGIEDLSFSEYEKEVLELLSRAKIISPAK